MLKLIERIKIALKPDPISADLVSILSALGPLNSYQERMIALRRLMDWLRLPVDSAAPEGVPAFIHSRDLRVKFLFSHLEKNSDASGYLAATLAELISPGTAVGLYCLTGLTENHGFFGELLNRLVIRILPETFTEKDLAEIFKVLFTSEEDALWFETTFKNNYQHFLTFFQSHSLTLEPLKSDLQGAKMILSAQIATLGTSRDIRRRLEKKKLADSSFLKLNLLLSAKASDSDILEMISLCRLELESMRSNLEHSGVSVDLIFKLEKINSILDRIEMVIYLGKEYGPAAHLILGQFIGRLIRDELKTRGVREYINESLHLLTRKIVERAGEKGDHYIAATVPDQKKLFVAAMLAGILTAFTAFFKFMIGIPQFPIFFEGFFFFVNYALSFLIMQRWHLALSSKQPAYMASALSRHFEKFKKDKNFFEVGLEIKKILRSQVITTIGNLLWVLPGCLLIDWLWRAFTGSPLMDQTEAWMVINKHHPLKSFTIGYAFLTGVLLWVSSVIAGWVENLIVFREIPEILKNSRILKKLLPKDQLEQMARHLPGTIGGISGNLSIAFLLTVPIVISKFTAIPLDIRHVTLAAGTVTFALNSIGWSMENWPAIFWMASSILLIGLLNFSVSFYFAIRLASIARSLDPRNLRRIFKFAFSSR